MEFFRQTNRRTLVLWSLLLSLSLLCGQSVKLHFHSLDHDHDAYLDHAYIPDEAGDHTHLSKAHSISDISHDDHHNGVVSEVDASPDGMLKNLSNNIFTFALFFLFFALLLAVPARSLVYRHRESAFNLLGRYIISPPLRAPPLL